MEIGSLIQMLLYSIMQSWCEKGFNRKASNGNFLTVLEK